MLCSDPTSSNVQSLAAMQLQKNTFLQRTYEISQKLVWSETITTNINEEVEFPWGTVGKSHREAGNELGKEIKAGTSSLTTTVRSGGIGIGYRKRRRRRKTFCKQCANERGAD